MSSCEPPDAYSFFVFDSTDGSWAKADKEKNSGIYLHIN